MTGCRVPAVERLRTGPSGCVDVRAGACGVQLRRRVARVPVLRPPFDPLEWYAGVDMNKLLSQSTDGGAEYDYTYGTTDQHGVPVITSRTVADTGTASVISDPVTGQPMDLQTTDGATSMWVVDGIGNPTAAITDTAEKAYEVHYDPYGAERITDQDKASVQWQQNPYGFKAGLRSSSADNGLTKFGYRWQTSVTCGWIERDTLDAPLDPTNANRYAYAADDPINSFDPSGRAIGLVRGLAAATGLYSTYGALSGEGTPAGYIAGSLAEIGCGLTAAAVGVGTAGVGAAVVGFGCFALGEYVSSQASAASVD